MFLKTQINIETLLVVIQSGHRMSINANGDLHVCVHEEESYGNVSKTSIQEVYQNEMRTWHNKTRGSGCKGCEYIEMCESGCQMFLQ